uniref:Venom protein family 14 protein 1b n=1 Tax=Pristhesancus plagipennis TaxID=1955184 RepID=A0A2K8JM52_PRIPG|nr:venom protein family 14 protein 1b [Pristhesancus plagipennis]
MYYKVVFNIVSFVLIESIIASISPLTFPNENEQPLNIRYKQFPNLKKSENANGKLENYGVPTTSYKINDATNLITSEPLKHLHDGIIQDIGRFGTSDNHGKIKYIPIHSDMKDTGNYVTTDIGKVTVDGKPIESSSLLLGNGLANWITNLNNGRGPYGQGFVPMPNHGLGPGLSVKNDGSNNKQFGIFINQPFHISEAQKDKGEYSIANQLEAENRETGEINLSSKVIRKETKIYGQDTKDTSQEINNLLHTRGYDRIVLEYLLRQLGTNILGGNQQNNLSANNRALYLLQLQQMLNNMPAAAQQGGLDHLLLQLIRNPSQNLVQGQITNNEDSSKIVKIGSVEINNQSASNHQKFHPENISISSLKTVDGGESTKTNEKGNISKIVKIITIMNHDNKGSASNVNQMNEGNSGMKIIKIEGNEKLNVINNEQKQFNVIDKSKVTEQMNLSGNQHGKKKKCDKHGKFIIAIEKEENSETGIKENKGDITNVREENIMNKPEINLGHNTIKFDKETQNLENKEENMKAIHDNIELQINKDTEIIDSLYEKEIDLQASKDGWINSNSKGSNISEDQQEKSKEGNIANTATEEQNNGEKQVNNQKIVESDFGKVQNINDAIVSENEKITEKLESANDKKESIIEDAGIVDNGNSKDKSSETVINEGGTREPENGGVSSNEDLNKVEDNNKEEVISEGGNKEESNREGENKEVVIREEGIKTENSDKGEGNSENGIKIEDTNKEEGIDEGGNKVEEGNNEEGNKGESNTEEGIKIENNKEEGISEEENKMESKDKEENNSKGGNKEESKIEEENKEEGNSEEAIKIENKEEGISEEGNKIEEGNSEEGNKEESNKEDGIKIENNKEEGNIEEAIKIIEDNNKENGISEGGNIEENFKEEGNKEEGNSEEGNKNESNSEENKKEEINNEQGNQNKVTKEKGKCRKEFPGLYVLTVIKPTKKDYHHTENKQLNSQNILKLKLDIKKPNNDIVLKHKDNEYSITVEVGGLSSMDKPLIKHDKMKKCDDKRKKYKSKKENVWRWLSNKKKNGKFPKLNKYEKFYNKQLLKKPYHQLTALNFDKTSIKPKPNEKNQIDYYIIKKKIGKNNNLVAETRPKRKGKFQKIKFFTVSDDRITSNGKDNFNNKLKKVKYVIIKEEKQKLFQKPQNKFNSNRRFPKGRVNFQRLPQVLKKLLIKETKDNDELMASSEDNDLENERYILVNNNDLSKNRNILLNLIQENLDNEDESGSKITSLNNPLFIKQKHIIKVPNKNKKLIKKLSKYFLLENNLENENVLNIPKNYYSYNMKTEEQLNNKENPLNYIVLRENSIKPENDYNDLESKGQLIEEFSEDYQKYLSLIESSNNPETILEISQDKDISSLANSLGYIVISEKSDDTDQILSKFI